MPSRQQTEDQKRAAQAWRCIEAVREQTFRKEYKSLAQKLPTLILTNGLGQTLAFLRAKGKGNSGNEHGALYSHLSQWVMKQVKGEASDNLLNWIVESDSLAYRRAATESLAFLGWLKRFAEAELS
jgi:CRISPR-associated protein Cmr5